MLHGFNSSQYHSHCLSWHRACILRRPHGTLQLGPSMCSCMMTKAGQLTIGRILLIAHVPARPRSARSRGRLRRGWKRETSPRMPPNRPEAPRMPRRSPPRTSPPATACRPPRPPDAPWCRTSRAPACPATAPPGYVRKRRTDQSINQTNSPKLRLRAIPLGGCLKMAFDSLNNGRRHTRDVLAPLPHPWRQE